MAGNVGFQFDHAAEYTNMSNSMTLSTLFCGGSARRKWVFEWMLTQLLCGTAIVTITKITSRDNTIDTIGDKIAINATRIIQSVCTHTRIVNTSRTYHESSETRCHLKNDLHSRQQARRRLFAGTRQKPEGVQQCFRPQRV